MSQPIERLHVSAYSRAPTDIERDFYAQMIRRFKVRREEMGLSQEDMEARLGLAEGQMAKWETFARVPGAFMMMCWSNALGLSLFAFALDLEAQTTSEIENAGKAPAIQGGSPCQPASAAARLETGNVQQMPVPAPLLQLRRGAPLALRSLLQKVAPQLGGTASSTPRANILTGTGLPALPKGSATAS